MDRDAPPELRRDVLDYVAEQRRLYLAADPQPEPTNVKPDRWGRWWKFLTWPCGTD